MAQADPAACWLARVRMIQRELDALAEYEAGLATERRVLIRRMLGAGRSQQRIARELGISQPRVHQILNPDRRKR